MNNILISLDGCIRLEHRDQLDDHVATYFETVWRDNTGNFNSRTYKLVIHDKEHAIYKEVENE